MSVNANLEMLTKIHGDGAERAFREIQDLGGFGNSSDGLSAHAGGLDVQGVLDPANEAVSSKAKDRIAELCGVDRKASDNFETTSSASKMKTSDKEK